MRSYRSLGNLRKRCGCARRTWETCQDPWYFTFQWRGRVERGSLGVSDRQAALVKLTAIRAAIMAGTYVNPKSVPTPTIGAETFATIADRYKQQHVAVKNAEAASAFHDGVVRFLGSVNVPSGGTFTEKIFRAITLEDCEIAVDTKRLRGHVGANRMITHLSALWTWACSLRRGYADRNPFVEIKKTREHGRDRRLAPGEEEDLLAAAGPHLRDLIVAALETGCRKGELLSLQWRSVRWLQNELVVEAAKAKTDRPREIPLSPTMRDLLVRRQAATPKGVDAWKPDHFVFGNEIGEQVHDVRTAFDNCVLRAHGVKVVRGHGGRVSPENRAKLRAIDLNFHDLRHEAASRKAEREGYTVPDVSAWLGHTKITTTQTYLNTSKRRLHELNDRRRAG